MSGNAPHREQPYPLTDAIAVSYEVKQKLKSLRVGDRDTIDGVIRRLLHMPARVSRTKRL